MVTLYKSSVYNVSTMSETESSHHNEVTDALPETGQDDSVYTPELSKDTSPKLAGTGHEIELKYAPEFYAKGGEQLVYKIPSHPDIVVKASMVVLRNVIAKLEANPNISSDEILCYGKEVTACEGTRRSELKMYFGKNVLPQRSLFMKIPVTPGILARVYPDRKVLSHVNEAWAIVTIQRYTDAVKSDEKLGVQCGYTERADMQGITAQERQAMSEEYERVTDRLVFLSNPQLPLSRDEFLQVQKHPSLRVLLEHSDMDETLKDELKNLITNMIRFTNETDELIDLAGRDNVLFYRSDGKWTHVLIDPLVSQSKIIRRVRNAFRENTIDATSRRLLPHVLNYIRTVNGLAEQLDISERICSMHDVKRGDGVSLYDLAHNGLDGT